MGEVVYPSNSFQEEEPSTATEQTSFSSFPSRESISGPNPEDFPIISLIDQGHNYYDEVVHLYYSPEEFRYNQDPIDLDLVHGSGPEARDLPSPIENLVIEEEKSSSTTFLPVS